MHLNSFLIQNLVEKRLRLEIFFQFCLEQVIEVIFLGERVSNVQSDNFTKVAENVYYLSFQVFEKIL